MVGVFCVSYYVSEIVTSIFPGPVHMKQRVRCAGDHPLGSGCDFVERAWLWVVSPFSCVEAKEGVGREASSFFQARQEERKGEGVFRNVWYPGGTVRGFSNMSPL